jgi:pyruvate-formate lyase-activating enzyme
MIEEKKLLDKMDSKNLFCHADLSDIFKSLKKEPKGCTHHCPFCGAVCEWPNKDHDPSKHKLFQHYFPGFFGTKLMIQSETEVEIRLVDNMTCTQIRWLMGISDNQDEKEKKEKREFAELVLNQKN